MGGCAVMLAKTGDRADPGVLYALARCAPQRPGGAGVEEGRAESQVVCTG
jgi:hypothetical protein